jgi:excisionase family DNA binding protein
MSEGKMLLTTGEVAALTGFSEGTIRHWTSQNRIPHVRISARCVRYTVEAIQAWVAEKAAAPVGGDGLCRRASRRGPHPTGEISTKLDRE